MSKLGFGAPEETLYLRAYDLAESGHPTLLFSFEAATIKLIKSLMSHKLGIPVDDLDLTDDTLVNDFQERIKEFASQFIYVDVTSLSVDEIEKIVRRNKKEQGITHVVLDRVNKEDRITINQIGIKYGVSVIY